MAGKLETGCISTALLIGAVTTPAASPRIARSTASEIASIDAAALRGVGLAGIAHGPRFVGNDAPRAATSPAARERPRIADQTQVGCADAAAEALNAATATLRADAGRLAHRDEDRTVDRRSLSGSRHRHCAAGREYSAAQEHLICCSKSCSPTCWRDGIVNALIFGIALVATHDDLDALPPR